MNKDKLSAMLRGASLVLLMMALSEMTEGTWAEQVFKISAFGFVAGMLALQVVVVIVRDKR
jgi:uncharacterized membrane protein